jgi:alcohol oxidase
MIFDEWDKKGTGPLATNGIDAGVKIRPTEQELGDMKKKSSKDSTSGFAR